MPGSQTHSWDTSKEAISKEAASNEATSEAAFKVSPEKSGAFLEINQPINRASDRKFFTRNIFLANPASLIFCADLRIYPRSLTRMSAGF
jgi:hypothetical protein